MPGEKPCKLGQIGRAQGTKRNNRNRGVGKGWNRGQRCEQKRRSGKENASRTKGDLRRRLSARKRRSKWFPALQRKSSPGLSFWKGNLSLLLGSKWGQGEKMSLVRNHNTVTLPQSTRSTNGSLLKMQVLAENLRIFLVVPLSFPVSCYMIDRWLKCCAPTSACIFLRNPRTNILRGVRPWVTRAESRTRIKVRNRATKNKNIKNRKRLRSNQRKKLEDWLQIKHLVKT